MTAGPGAVEAPREPGVRGRATARLHVVTDDAVVGRADFLDVAASILEAGGERVALHVRAPGAPGAEVHAAVCALLPEARAADAELLVNDRVDVALVTGADGAHLGRRSLPTRAARALLGPGVTLGRSVHTARGAAEAEADGADFALVGTIYDTPSHPAGTVGGPALLAEACAAVDSLPVLAIGGVTPERIAEVAACGAGGVAVLRGVWGAPEPAVALAHYLEELDEHMGGSR